MNNDIVYQLEKINDKLQKLETETPQFSESFEVQPDFSESFKELGLMAAGGAVSPIVSNIVNKWVPIGNLGSGLVGLALKFIVKNNTVQDVANGMIVSSLSMFLSNLMAGKIGFSEGEEEYSFSENRVGGVNFG